MMETGGIHSRIDSLREEVERLKALLMKACDPDRINVHVLKPTEEMVKREVIEDLRAWVREADKERGILDCSFYAILDTYCKEKGLE